MLNSDNPKPVQQINLIKRVCTECVWNVTQDEGYSEYTVTGASYVCLHAERADISDEGAPEEEVRTLCEYADTCNLFREGTGRHVTLGSTEDNVQEWIDWIKNFPKE